MEFTRKYITPDHDIIEAIFFTQKYHDAEESKVQWGYMDSKVRTCESEKQFKLRALNKKWEVMK